MSLGKGIFLVVLLTAMERTCFAVDQLGAAWLLYEDTVVASGERILVKDINIEQSLYLTNMGYINSHINVCSTCNLRIENIGAFEGDIHADAGGSVVQVIHNEQGIGALNVQGRYDILVDGARDISWDDLYSSAVLADKIILQDSYLHITDGIIASNKDSVAIELRGEVIFDIGDTYKFDESVLLSNVTGDGAISIVGRAPSPLYAMHVMVKEGDVLLQLQRETDYYKILRDKRGAFLNIVRKVNPDDITLAKLDAATTMSELQRIISKSVILNPINLIRRVRALNVFLGDVDFYLSPMDTDFKVFGDSQRIASDEFDAYIENIVGHLRLSDNVYLSAGVHAATMGMSDYNWGSTPVYGGGIAINYLSDTVLARAEVRGSYAKFALPYVYDGRGVAQNPNGVALRAGADVGRSFRYGDDLLAVSFLGVEYDAYEILHQSESVAHMRIGGELKYLLSGVDLKYEYVARGTVNDAGRTMLSGSIGFVSPYDDAGGNIGVAVLREGDGIAWKLSLGGKYLF